MNCPKCQAGNPDDMKFCGECGTRLERVCPKCHFPNLPQFKFCGQCGHDLITPEEAPSLDFTRPQSYTPEFLADQILTPPSTLEGERKQVTALFSDLSGYTAMSERLDPEEVKQIMGQIFGEIAAVVNKYDGSIQKFIGDAVVAFFGVPKAHEDDPIRAIRAANELYDRVNNLSHQFEGRVGKPFLMHTGINTGLVVTGEVKIEKGTLGITGDTVNVASRLSGLAKPGEILVGQNTYHQAEGFFNFERLEPTRVKGKAEPVLAYRVLGPRVKMGRVSTLAMRGISSALVGRDGEFAAIKSCVNRLLDGQGGILCVVGEAGIGKSRLITEIRDHTARVEGLSSLHWLEGRTLSFGHAISYCPFQEILRHYAGITEDDSEMEAWGKLESKVTALFAADADEILPYLASLLTLNLKSEYAERLKYLSGEPMGRQVFLASRRFFERLAQAQPLMLVFEDLHWADESSILLLEHLLPLVKRVPLLICGISRPDLKSPAARLGEIAVKDYEGRYTEIRLNPLSPGEGAQLMRNLVRIENLPPRMEEIIIKKAEGNPFFLEEIMRSLIDRGALVRDAMTEHWRATGKIETIAIPDTIEGVIMARLDRLEEDLKQVLRSAAVIGRSFLYRVLRAIAEADQELDRHLNELRAIELIREKQQIPELEYIFKHALVHEATYESMLLQKRREIHARVSQAIEALFSDRLEEFYSLLAYHYARAEKWERAQEYLFKAGDQAGKVAADAEALEHYRQALAAYARAFGERWDPFQRAVLERKMGEALFRRGEHSQAREYLQRALISLGSPYPSSPRGLRWAVVRQGLRQALHRFLPRRFWESTDNRPDRTAEERCRIYSAMGWMDYFIDPERLVLDCLLELNLAEESGLAVEAVLASMGVGLACDAIPLPWLARRYHFRAVNLADQIQQPLAVGQAYLGLALHEHHALGEGERALAHYQQSAAAYWEAGHLRRWAGVNMAASLLWLGRNFADSLHLGQEVVRISQDAADIQAWGWGLFMMGIALDHAGELDKAVAHLQQALDLGKGVPDHQVSVFASGILARCHLRQGNVEKALTVLEEGRERVHKHRLRGFSCVPLRMSLAQAYLSLAERADGPARADALGRAKWACQVAMKQGKFDRVSLVATWRMRGTYQWLRKKPESAHRSWHRSLQLAEELHARYEAGLTHLEMGRCFKERANLERAKGIFAEIGAEWDLERTRKLLETK